MVFLEQYALSQIQYPGYHKYIMIKYSVEITCSQIHWSALYTCLSVWNLEVKIWFQGGVSTYSHNQASRLKKIQPNSDYKPVYNKKSLEIPVGKAFWLNSGFRLNLDLLDL